MKKSDLIIQQISALKSEIDAIKSKIEELSEDYSLFKERHDKIDTTPSVIEGNGEIYVDVLDRKRIASIKYMDALQRIVPFEQKVMELEEKLSNLEDTLIKVVCDENTDIKRDLEDKRDHEVRLKLIELEIAKENAEAAKMASMNLDEMIGGILKDDTPKE